MYKVVDLFAGAGGLSLGFMQTQKYDIKVAFENSPYMQDTYRLNHPGVEVRGDVCTADYDAIKKKKFLDNPLHLILTSAHPSPLSCYRGFFGSKPFSKTNAYLKEHNMEEIKWLK